MQSLEGRRAEPRVKPPFPAQKGIFGCPTTVNNVQTLSYVPHIINNGAEWFKGLGSEKYPGTFVFCVSGHVKNPGLFEVELGKVTMRDLIYDYAGGLYDGRELKAVIPGGASTPPMTPDQIDVVMDPANFLIPGRGELQAMFGTGGMIVMDDTACMVDALLNLMNFLCTRILRAVYAVSRGMPLDEGHRLAYRAWPGSARRIWTPCLTWRTRWRAS